MNEKKRWPEILIGLMLLLALACAVLAIHAGDKKAHHWGPRILEQSAAGDVWFVYDQELLIARPDGALRHRVSLSSLGLPGPVNAIVPLPSPDGGTRMLVGVIKHPEWLVMDSEGKVIERLKPYGIDVPFHETFHLAAAPDGRIAMSTGGDHRVLLFDAQGQYLTQTTPGLLRFANGLWYENGQWWVVDTNHRQVRALNGATLKPESALTAPYSGGYRVPALARRSKTERGTITLSVMQNNMQHGMVMDINQSGELLRTYRSPAKHPQPADFLWLGNELLVTESDGFALHLFDQTGGYLKTWGDKNIQSALKQAHRERVLWGKVLLGAQVGAIVLGLLAIIAYFGWKRLQQLVPEHAQSDMRSRLGTPSLSRGDEFVASMILFWPLYLAILTMFALLKGLGPFLMGPLTTFLKQLPASWLTPALFGLLISMTVVLTGLVVLTARIVQKRMKQPRFEAVLSARALRWFKRTKAAQEALEPDEFAQEVVMVRGGGLFPAFNMKVCVLTNRRVLIFDLGTGAAGKLLMAHPRHQVAARIDSAGPAWLRWVAKQDKLHIQLGDDRTFSGYPVSPLTARRMVELLTLSHAAPLDAARVESPPFDLRSPKPIVSFALSLLIPGLAQMRQDRFRLGLILLMVMLTNIAFVLTPVLLGWIGHFYDVSLGRKITPILFLTVWALFAATDAWNYARKVHCPARIKG
ncbi:MAG: hypothetical protein Q8L39_09790 [Burkholderiales bacterium]|nr:hypothetical protein [Burkholderiales bacterium]